MSKNTQILVYWWSGILENINLYNSIDKSQNYCVEWRKYLFIVENNHNGGCCKVGGFLEKEFEETLWVDVNIQCIDFSDRDLGVYTFHNSLNNTPLPLKLMDFVLF